MHGAYKSAKRGKQLLLFSGLEYDNHVAPMDLDGMIEYHDKKRVFLEVKLQNTPVPEGERIALERLVNDCGKAGKKAIAIVADHNVFDTSQDVIVQDCMVRVLYYSEEGHWRTPKRSMTVKTLVDSFLLQ